MAQSLPSTSSVLTPQHPHTPVTQEFSEDLNLRLSLTPDTNGELPGPSSALVRSQLWCLVLKIKFTSLQHFLYPGPAVKQTPILKYDRWCQWSGPGSSSYGRFIRTISSLFLSLFLIASVCVAPNISAWKNKKAAFSAAYSLSQHIFYSIHVSCSS